MSTDKTIVEVMDAINGFRNSDDMRYIDVLQFDMDLESAIKDAVEKTLTDYGVNLDTDAGRLFLDFAVEPAISNAVTLLTRTILP